MIKEKLDTKSGSQFQSKLEIHKKNIYIVCLKKPKCMI